MDSDDSAASEVASDAEAYDDSFAADEIEEDEVAARPAVRPVPIPGPGPVPSSSSRQADDASDPYADDDYEADEDAYSVDFEDADEEAKAKKAPARSPMRRDAPPPAIAEDAEYAYSEASFEDESRHSQSINRLVVDLSVPVRRDSNSSQGSSPQTKAHLNPNSPNVNLKVLSKPTGLPSPGKASSSRPVLPPAQASFVHPQAQAMLEIESDKSLSLLLRKMESKYQDELEELRERNALLTWKERELKTELRIHKEEIKMRKSRMEKKRKRATERRRETEMLVERLRGEVVELTGKLLAAEQRGEQQLMANESLRVMVEQNESERRNVEARNLVLAEKLQATLSDFHALNLKYEDAVGSKLDAERRVDELMHHHKMQCEVLEHKARIDVEAVQKTLQLEREAWRQERATLPESHRAMVENEMQRLEKLEAQVKQRTIELEAHVAKESVRFERELALAWEAKKTAEDRAEKRLHEELAKIGREREALDEQRRELLMSMTKSSSRIDEERGRLDATREQLEVRRLKLVEERAELDAKVAYVEDRVHRLAQEESVLDARKAEVTKLGRETFEKSRLMAQRMSEFVEMKREIEKMRAAQLELQAKVGESEEHEARLQMQKAALEKTARQLQHERLMVARQRIQSRQFLDGAKKLELLLHQQKALDQVAVQAGSRTHAPIS